MFDFKVAVFLNTENFIFMVISVDIMAQLMKKVLRYPRLDTILMVEETVKSHDGEFMKKQLWENLPKKMMYQTFCVIIDYLYGRKISIDSQGKIGWIYYPDDAREWHAKTRLGRRK